MTQKNNPSLHTEHQNYPLPSQEHLLQDDVDNLSQALQQIDTDVHQLQQDIQTAEANAKTASQPEHWRLGTLSASQFRFSNQDFLGRDNKRIIVSAKSGDYHHLVINWGNDYNKVSILNHVFFTKIPEVNGKPLALDQDLKSLTKRLDDANDVYELIKAATQVMQSGGTFTPTAEAMYPDVTSINVDTQWLLRFASVDASLTFTAGALKDQTAHSGDILFYNTPSNAFILIPSAQTQLLNDAVAKAVSDAQTHTDTQVAEVKTQVEQLIKTVVVSSESEAKTESTKPENQDKIYVWF
jgi:hypothetical protein